MKIVNHETKPELNKVVLRQERERERERKHHGKGKERKYGLI